MRKDTTRPTAAMLLRPGCLMKNTPTSQSVLPPMVSVSRSFAAGNPAGSHTPRYPCVGGQ